MRPSLAARALLLSGLIYSLWAGTLHAQPLLKPYELPAAALALDGGLNFSRPKAKLPEWLSSDELFAWEETFLKQVRCLFVPNEVGPQAAPVKAIPVAAEMPTQPCVQDWSCSLEGLQATIALAMISWQQTATSDFMPLIVLPDSDADVAADFLPWQALMDQLLGNGCENRGLIHETLAQTKELFTGWIVPCVDSLTAWNELPQELLLPIDQCHETDLAASSRITLLDVALLHYFGEVLANDTADAARSLLDPFTVGSLVESRSQEIAYWSSLTNEEPIELLSRRDEILTAGEAASFTREASSNAPAAEIDTAKEWDLLWKEVVEPALVPQASAKSPWDYRN